MRQAGLKPKSHSSGVYWTRANAKSGGGKAKRKPNPDDFHPADENMDGEISDEEWQIYRASIIGKRLGILFAIMFVIFGLFLQIGD